MNKWMMFLGGMLAGIALSLVFSFLVNYSDTKGTNSEENDTEAKSDNGLQFFDEPGDIINEKSLMVFQVLEDHAALVRGRERERSSLYLGTVYLLVNSGEDFYYDDEKIDIPKGKVLQHIGMYRYTTKEEFVKNVPVITIVDAK